MLEDSMKVIAGCVALCALLAIIAWLSNSTGAVHRFADANPTPGCRVAEATKTHIRYMCSDGKEVIEKRKIEER